MTYKDKPEFIAECMKRWVESWELAASGKIVKEDDDGEEHTVVDEDFEPEDFVGQLREHGLPELSGLVTELQQMLKTKAA